jgi:hypothetical protein
LIQPLSLFDPSNKNPDPGPGVGAGFGTGVLTYVALLLLGIFFAFNVFSGYGIGALISTNLIVNLVIDGGLIWHSLANNRKSFAQGLIIYPALAALLDNACWKIAH